MLHGAASRRVCRGGEMVKLFKASIVYAMFSLFLTALAFGADGGLIKVTIENVSAFPVQLQVKDEVCKTPLSDACVQADFIAKSADCMKTPLMDACVRAKQKLDGGSCVEGLTYEGNIDAGGKALLSLCAGPSGYGRVSMRSVGRSSLWKTNHLVSNGDRLTWP
jgi:hypothetical protein